MNDCKNETCCKEKNIAKEFAYHKPSEEGLKIMEHFRIAFSDLWLDIRDKVKGCPELTLTQRKLEEASMFLNKAINLTDPNAVAILTTKK